MKGRKNEGWKKKESKEETFLYKRMKLKTKNSQKTLILILCTWSHRTLLFLNGNVLSSTPQIFFFAKQSASWFTGCGRRKDALTTPHPAKMPSSPEFVNMLGYIAKGEIRLQMELKRWLADIKIGMLSWIIWVSQYNHKASIKTGRGKQKAESQRETWLEGCSERGSVAGFDCGKGGHG